MCSSSTNYSFFSVNKDFFKYNCTWAASQEVHSPVRSPPPLGSQIYLAGCQNFRIPEGRPQHLKITQTHLVSCLGVESAQRCQSRTAVRGSITSVALLLTFELTASLPRHQRGGWVCVYACVIPQPPQQQFHPLSLLVGKQPL